MRYATIVFALAALASAAFAATEDELMVSRYGNTLVIKDAFGTSRVYYNRDHTFEALSWVATVRGTWKIENGKMCLYAIDPPLVYRAKYSNPECDDIAVHNVGDQWDINGRHYQLVRGIQRP